MKALRNLLNWLLRKQGKAIASVTIATITNNLVGFGVNVMGARTLGKEKFGLFSLAFAVATMTAAIAEFGLNLTMIRLFNMYNEHPDKQTALLSSVLAFKVCMWGVILVVSFPVSRLIVAGLGLSVVEQRLFAVAVVTGGVLLFWAYVQAFLQCHRSFGRLTAYILIYAGLRLVCLTLSYILYPDNPLAWLVATYTLPGVLIGVTGLLPQVRELQSATVKRTRIDLRLVWEALDYSKWVALSSVAYISLLAIVRFFLLARSSPAEVGIFSAGITFTMAFATLNTAIRAVLFPQVTSLDGSYEISGYLGKLRQSAPYYGFVAATGIGVLAAFQWFLLGEGYRAALPVFIITSSALSVTVFLGLGTMLVHTMMKPQIDAYINVGRVGAMAILAIILIPPWRALGAAVAYAVPLVSGELSMFFYVRHQNRRKI